MPASVHRTTKNMDPCMKKIILVKTFTGILDISSNELCHAKIYVESESHPQWGTPYVMVVENIHSTDTSFGHFWSCCVTLFFIFEAMLDPIDLMFPHEK